ncbi:SPO22-domain-containing protein [Mytilinidion resinicola]|uniref:Protein ZIP4 homolog n=1 Tax=Mytilinidion resinicola TaxID=574789 RepID=A0A6A6Y5I3_9PEZI|nr:SPO22-domain-containing protein [Mytilinidion resinicola]KAF2804066.1 SPO22-domain-containing protein [Mytilinidion resinicola]
MAPSNTLRSEREKKIKALLTFADSISTRLTSNPFDTTLATDLQAQITSLPLPASSALNAKRDELDKVGTELWNTSTRLKREESREGLGKKVLCLLRAFAFLLLESAAAGLKRKGTAGADSKDEGAVVRLMKVALKSSRVCLEAGMVDVCSKVMERAATLEEELAAEKDAETGPESDEANRRLRVEYLVLRSALAWRQGRMDIAEHMFSKDELSGHQLDPAIAESLSDLLYEIGKDQLKHGRYEAAVKWLERAHEMLGDHELERLSADAGELRLSIMQSLGMHAVLGEANFTNDGSVQSLLKLSDLPEESDAHTIDGDQYYGVLLRMARSAVLTETSLKTCEHPSIFFYGLTEIRIMHHVYKLKDQSNATACKILDDLIRIRLFGENNQDWIEKVTITRTWITTKGPHAEDMLEGLRDIFDEVSQNTKTTFSAPATHAAQTLIWKQIEYAYSQNEYQSSEAWCALAVHALFDKAGESNKAKIARKMILCALARKDWEAARDAFTRMSDFGKAEPMTRYIMYKASLRSGDAELATQCLDIVCQQSTKDATLLYACVLEAQQTGDKRQAVVALQKVLEKYDYGAPAGVNLPALLRCTVRLLSPLLVENGKINEDVAEELSKVLEGGACMKFILLVRDQKTSDMADELTLRLLFCDFLSACAYVVLARAEDNLQASAQRYLSVRYHADNFMKELSDYLEKADINDNSKKDLISKHFQLVKFSLEASLKLSDWESMDALFEKCFAYHDPKHYATLADLVLTIHSYMLKRKLPATYLKKILRVLQTVIDRAWQNDNSGNPLPNGGIHQLARWIRCLFQLAMGLDESLAQKCLSQAVAIAEKRKGTAERFPSLELEWLVATAWNHTVDLYCMNDDKKCEVWADLAMALAGAAEDGGALQNTLVGNRSGLQWEKAD